MDRETVIAIINDLFSGYTLDARFHRLFTWDNNNRFSRSYGPAKDITLTDGATVALDASQGYIFMLTAAGNRTISPPINPSANQKLIIKHKASGGVRTLALSASAGGFRFGTSITALAATASGKIDYIGAIYNVNDNFWDVVAYVQGY